MDIEEAIATLRGRTLAHEALFNIVFRDWGRPISEVMGHLREASERVTADVLANPMPDAQVHAAQQTLALALAALAHRTQDPPRGL